MKKSPAFQFYPSDYLGSQRVQLMTLEEEGAYCRLLCYCWQHGSIPSDPAIVARLVGKGCSTTVATEVLKMFDVGCADDRVTNGRLEAERIKQEQWREKSSQGGRKSTELRKSAEGGSRVVEPPNQPNGNSSSPSSSPSSSSSSECTVTRFAPPTLEEVKERVKEVGMPEVEAVKFWNYYQANGWRAGRTKMKSWPHAVVNWKAGWEERQQKFNQPRPDSHGVLLGKRKVITDAIDSHPCNPESVKYWKNGTGSRPPEEKYTELKDLRAKQAEIDSTLIGIK